MREIKFRAWDRRTNKMQNWEQMKNTMACVSGGHTFYFGLHPEIETMQFTGLKDSKKQEIWESDIIECEYYPDLPTTKNHPLVWRGVVKWGADASFHVIRHDDHGKFGNCYAVRYGGSAVKRWEVIGNIYENPELLT